MRRTHRSGGFFLSLLINMLLNAEGVIPAAVLLGLHFWLGWSLWWAAGALALWIVWLCLGTLLLGWANRCGNAPVPEQRNKNPYSAKKQQDPPGDRPDKGGF